jgi:hypothetical protein
MTATLAGSQAALKILYPDGELPKSINEMFNFTNRLKKDTSFVGELAYVPIQNANPQGSSADLATAQTAVFQGSYLRFALTRKSHFGVARVTGEAAEAAVKSEGAMVDLWDNETRGIATTEKSVQEIYAFGTGDATLGTMGGSGSVTASTVTLASGTNMNYFELNELLGMVSAVGMSPTIRAGTIRVTGIDRKNRTLTFAANLDSGGSTGITSPVNTDYFVRAGDAATASPTVINGLGSYIVGGPTPGTLDGLNRNTDPVRLAGQTNDYQGVAGEDAVVDASSLAGFQGIGYPNVLVCNNIEAATMKKSLAGKMVYNRPGSTAASYSFSDITIEGENGAIEVLTSPFCPRNKAWLVKIDQFSMFSLKAAPHLADFDGIKFLRRPDADAYEVRFVFYGNMKCKNPGPHVALTNFCVP